jgi:hypothetical protein
MHGLSNFLALLEAATVISINHSAIVPDKTSSKCSCKKGRMELETMETI